MILLTGGVKSGKSAKALELALKYKKRAFIATGVAFDEEMTERIEKHKKQREGLFDTFEEPVQIDKVISKIKDQYDVIVVDCITTWLGNLFHYFAEDEKKIEQTIESFLTSLTGKEILITNEVGWGVIPVEKLTRKYVDTIGKLNAKLASMADEVYLTVCGIGVKIK